MQFFNSIFTDNFGGRAVHATDSLVSMFGVHMIRNGVNDTDVSEGGSGAVLCQGLNVSFTYLAVSNSLIDSSVSNADGGGIRAIRCRVDIVQSRLTGNTAMQGGAISISGDSLQVGRTRTSGAALAD